MSFVQKIDHNCLTLFTFYELYFLSPVHTDCDNGNDNGNGRMGYIGLYGSVHMETCGKGNINP